MSPQIAQLLQDQIASINQNPMSTQIVKQQDDLYLVNEKHVYQDSNNNWIAKEELTTEEPKAFRLHLSKVTGECVINKRP